MKLNKFFIVVVQIFILLILAKYFAYNMYPVKYEYYVEKYSKEYKVDKYLIYAVMRAESKFDNNAISHKDAKGLMQIMEPTGEWILGKNKMDKTLVKNLYDPKTNIMIGTMYLKYLLDKYDNDYKLTIISYNAGIGNVKKWIDNDKLDNIPFKETDNYYKKVMQNYKMYKMLYGGNDEKNS